MISYANKKIIVGVIQAITEERYLCHDNYTKRGLDENLAMLPGKLRRSSLIKNLSKFRLINRLELRLLFFLISTILTTILFLYYSIIKLFRRNIEINGSIYLNTSDNNLINQISKLDLSSYKISLPKYSIFINVSQLKYDKNLFNNINISILDVMSFSDILKSYIFSIKVTYYFFKRKDKKLIYYSPQLFYLFAVYFIVMQKNINEVWISENVNRWAVLTNLFKEKKIIIIQHGNLEQYFKNYGLYKYHLKNKLKKISLIFCYGKKHIDLYKKLILECKPYFIEINLNYKIIPRKNKNKFRVYIIGHKNIRAIAEDIMCKLNNDFPEKLEFIYRYHPTENAWKLKNTSIRIIYEYSQEFLNDFDLILNYGSSFYDNCEVFNSKPEIKWDHLANDAAITKIIDEIKIIIENSSMM